PFQERVAQIVGLGEDALVEGEPGQFAVDEARRRQRIGRAQIDDLPPRLCGGLRAGAHLVPPVPPSIWRAAERILPLGDGRCHALPCNLRDGGRGQRVKPPCTFGGNRMILPAIVGIGRWGRTLVGAATDKSPALCFTSCKYRPR